LHNEETTEALKTRNLDDIVENFNVNWRKTGENAVRRSPKIYLHKLKRKRHEAM
jgi:hypothetical protein